MHTNFVILSAWSVPDSYSYTSNTNLTGVPNIADLELLTNNVGVTGNSPLLYVTLSNTSDFLDGDQFIWNFGDSYTNTTLTATELAESYYSYIMPGNYDVTLTHNRPITSINAYTGATVTTINTQEITLPVATLNEISPKASISASKTGGVIPLDIEFTAVDSIPGSFTIDKFVWDFGDGITETSFLTSGTVNHIYNSAASNLTVSVTAFSSFTKTCGVTSLDIGPLTVPSLTSVSFDILKVRNTPHGNVYAVDINNSLTFIKSNI